MSQSVDERREHRPQARSTSIYSVALLILLVFQEVCTGVSVLQLPEIFAPLTPLVFQVVRTGVSVLQPRCGMVTLSESAWPCARRVLVPEAVDFRTSLALSPVDTASCCRARFSSDTAPWSAAIALATLRQDPTHVARFFPAPSRSDGI